MPPRNSCRPADAMSLPVPYLKVLSLQSVALGQRLLMTVLIPEKLFKPLLPYTDNVGKLSSMLHNNSQNPPKTNQVPHTSIQSIATIRSRERILAAQV